MVSILISLSIEILQLSATRKQKSCISSLCYSRVAFILIKSKIAHHPCQQQFPTLKQFRKDVEKIVDLKVPSKLENMLGINLLDTIKFSDKHLFNILHVTAMKQLTGTW